MSNEGTILTIDLEAVAANYRTLKAKSGKPTAAVVKADAYGLGMVAVHRGGASLDVSPGRIA